MKLKELVEYLDTFLRVREIEDFPGAFNGLQLENNGEVTCVAAAVDACGPVMQTAAREGADLLLAHHGMFWKGGAPLTGALYRKTRSAIESGLAVYSAHLPLDQHPELGNNILLAKAVGMKKSEPFLPMLNGHLGLKGRMNVSLKQLTASLERAVEGPVHVAAGGPPKAGMVGIVTGGGGGEIHRAAAEGIQTFITGEGPHWSYTAAEELGVNLLYAGHYATETFGVRALARHLEKKFGLPWKFVHHPTGL